MQITKEPVKCFCGSEMIKVGKPFVKICGITYQDFQCPKCNGRVNLRIK